MDLLELVAALELLADIRLRHGAALLPCLREWTRNSAGASGPVEARGGDGLPELVALALFALCRGVDGLLQPAVPHLAAPDVLHPGPGHAAREIRELHHSVRGVHVNRRRNAWRRCTGAPVTAGVPVDPVGVLRRRRRPDLRAEVPALEAVPPGVMLREPGDPGVDRHAAPTPRPLP